MRVILERGLPAEGRAGDRRVLKIPTAVPGVGRRKRADLPATNDRRGADAGGKKAAESIQQEASREVSKSNRPPTPAEQARQWPPRSGSLRVGSPLSDAECRGVGLGSTVALRSTGVRPPAPAVRRMLALVGQQAPFDNGRQQMHLLAGLDLTTKSVERTAEDIGADIARKQ